MTTSAPEPAAVRRLDHARLRDARPHVQHLDNGRYRVAISNAGSGWSECDGIALTRSQRDPVEDGDGWFCYLRDLDCARYWSIGHQPTGGAPERYGAVLARERVDIARVEDGIAATLSVALVPDAPVELRRCEVVNRSARPRRIELTSYLEVVLQAAAADAAHPAFAKLFVQTEAVAARHALLASRRPRAADEPRPWLVHWLIGVDPGAPGFAYETDRERFIGRGRDLAAPAALAGAAPLGGSVGNVLDPVLCLRTVLELAPGEQRSVAFGLGFAASRAAALELAGNHARLADLPPVLASSSAPEDVAPAAGQSGLAALYRPASGLAPEAAPAGEMLTFDNGFGGFAGDGREYVVRVAPDQRPPLPWTHVIANEGFGFITSESGAATTWAANSRENRLTPWSNDPVSDPHGEALYLRDEDARTFWSPMPGPVPAPARGEARYGFGWCRFSQTSAELEQEVCQFVPRRDPVKVTRIRLVNRAAQTRRLQRLQLCPPGPGRIAGGDRRRDRDCARSGLRRAACAQSCPRRVLGPGGVRARGGAGRGTRPSQRRPDRLHRPQRQPGAARGADRCDHARRAHRRRARALLRPPGRARARTGRERGARLPARRGRR